MTSVKSDKNPASLLKGRRFISTRPESRSAALKKNLGRYGAELLEMPMITIKPANINQKDKSTLENIPAFDWIVFTSENGVRYFMKEFEKAAGSGSLPPEISIAAIGSRTASAAEEYGMHPAFISRCSNAEGFSKELIPVFGGRHPAVLWPTGSLSPDKLEKQLEGYCDIERINLYRTEMPETINGTALRHIIEDTYDMIFFFSPSAVNNFLSVTRNEPVEPAALRAACIGPVTRDACTGARIIPLFTAFKAGSEALFESTIEYYRLKEKKYGIS
jgi:uroporphyrinogen-III synthase